MHNKRLIAFDVEDKRISFEVEGETAFGEDLVLLDGEDDLLSASPFENSGYSVEKFLSPDLNQKIREEIKKIIFNRINEIKKINLGLEEFRLENYHKYLSNEEHYQVVEPFRAWLDAHYLPIAIELIEERISEILRTKVSTYVPHYHRKTFAIRIVRPNSDDFNPPHRDPWLDILKNSVNSYFPIAGSSKDSSLPIMPRSHRWRESEIERTIKGAKINGREYTVPSVISSSHQIQMIRPNPQENEFLVFTPYLIHGGGANFQTDITRVSLEMRYWRAK